jgi:hypothetical protein
VRSPVLPSTVVLLAAAVALSGCTVGADPVDDPSDAASSPAAAPATPTPTPTPVATETAIETPAECETLDLAAGTVAGAELGPCVQAMLVRYDSGILTLAGDEIAGKVAYHYDPMFEFRGDLETGAGPAAISFVDGVMLLDEGDGPVVADVDGATPEEQSAGTTAEAYRVFSDPGFIGDLIGEGESWTVSSAPESVDLPGGEAIDAYRIDAAAPYAWFDIPIDAYTLWLTADARPVAAESTTAFLGRTATVTQQLSQLGEPVTILPLS